MEDQVLAQLLEEDKEQLLESISRDRTPPAAQAAAEKELDRVLYRYSEHAGSDSEAAAVQGLLQAARNALPLMGAVGEVREWQRSAAPAGGKRKLRPLGLVLAAAGLLLVLGSVLALLKNTQSPLTLPVLLPPLLGSACLVLGGLWLLPGRRESPRTEPEKKQEFLVDPAGVYGTLRGLLLSADRSLQALRESEKLREQESAAREGGLSREECELFASLLEAAYARRSADADAEEIIGSIRYYLHRRKVETIDYSKEQERWFELLPARRSGTIRPALVCQGRLVKKGLASAGEG